MLLQVVSEPRCPILVLAVLFESKLQQAMEQLEKRMDAAEQQIKELREDLNRRFGQLVEMIRKGAPLLPMKEIHLKKRGCSTKER